MKTILKYVLAVVLIQSFTAAYAQKSTVKSVETEYDSYYYVKTSEILLDVAENGYLNQEVLQKLGNSFYFNNNMEEASRWYKKLFEIGKNVDSEYYFRYALSLKGIKNYEESDKWMLKFKELNPSDSRGASFLERKNYMANIEKSSNEFIEVKNLNFNTKFSDFGTSFNGENLVFASSSGKEDEEKYHWNDQPFLDLYSTSKSSDDKFSEPKSFNENINTRFHESSAAFSPDGKTMYFTRNNYFKKRERLGSRGINRLKMFRATLDENGEWANVTPVHFNDNNYSVSHPSINAEGNRLYFASDMEGTLGNSDIYVVDINEDGTLGTPVNLGSSVNTEGQDSFPFISKNGDLYYSTNGLPGLGGYDIFVTRNYDRKVGSNSATNVSVSNIGQPFNSNKDDFGYYENIEKERLEGYFTSNRDGGKGDDDIYSFKELECNQIVKGTVRDSKTKELLPGATVILFDKKGKELEQVVVGDDAAFKFTVDCNEEYLARGSKVRYSTDEKRFTTSNADLDLEIGIELAPDEILISPCDDLAKSLDIPIIYFDFDKYAITKEAEFQLQKVLSVLNKYPSMEIDIRSHTDCRATRSYNERLSDNRAKATRQYLINKGISANRLTAKGYGESQLVNDCGCEPTNESSCSEAEHQKNRRSEFIITSFKGEKCSN